jgi:hypothetical protein
MNNYYKPFNFPDYKSVRKVLEEKYKDEFNPTELGTKLVPWTPENFIGLYEYVEKKFKLTNTTVQRARFFYTPGNTKLDAHIDGHTNFRFGKPTNLYWALNFPIIVPENNHIHQWYEYTGEYKREWNEKYTSGITPADLSLLVPKESLILDKPYFVNVGQLHSVTNSSSNPRLILSLRFESRTVFQFMESLK